MIVLSITGSENMNSPSVSELIIEGYGDGGFRAEHAAAVAMADTAPAMLVVLRNTKTFLESMPRSTESVALIIEIDGVFAKAITPAVANAS